jgi:hypothetical protein
MDPIASDLVNLYILLYVGWYFLYPVLHSNSHPVAGTKDQPETDDGDSWEEL